MSEQQPSLVPLTRGQKKVARPRASQKQFRVRLRLEVVLPARDKLAAQQMVTRALDTLRFPGSTGREVPWCEVKGVPGGNEK